MFSLSSKISNFESLHKNILKSKMEISGSNWNASMLCMYIVYRVARKFGGELNLAVWWSAFTIKSAKFLTHIIYVYMYMYGDPIPNSQFKSANISTMAIWDHRSFHKDTVEIPSLIKTLHIHGKSNSKSI